MKKKKKEIEEKKSKNPSEPHGAPQGVGGTFHLTKTVISGRIGVHGGSVKTQIRFTFI